MAEASFEPGEAQRREHGRLAVGILARFETLDGPQDVRLIDLSTGGAHLILSHPGEVRRGVLSWLDFEAFGETAWQTGDELGLAFDEVVTPVQLAATRLIAPEVVRNEELGDPNVARDFVAGRLSLGD